MIKIEKVKCKICGKSFSRVSKPKTCKLTGGIKKSGSVTCSKICSRINVINLSRKKKKSR
jgi:hypothetical protein